MANDFEISTNKIRANRPNPLRGFKYRVKDTEGKEIGGYGKVSGLKDSTDVGEYREGNDGNSIQKMAGLSNHDDITLERGLSVQGFMKAWRDKVMKWDKDSSDTNTSEEPDGYYKDLNIEILDRKGNVVRTYPVYRCFPNSYEIDDLDAKSSEVIMERVILTVEGSDLTVVNEGNL